MKPVYRMSSAGTCLRALSAERLGLEPAPRPKWLDAAAEEGKWHEQRIIKELETGQIDVPGYGLHYWQVENRQKEYSIDFTLLSLLGHIEGITFLEFPPPDNPLLLEIKSMSQFEFPRWMKGDFREFPHYADQLTCYMEATGLREALYIVKNRSSGYRDIRIVKGQPSNFTKIVEKLDNIETLAITGKLVPDQLDHDSMECRRCFYQHLCIVPVMTQLTPLSQTELTQAAGQWREGQKLVEQGEKLVKEARKVFSQQALTISQSKWQFARLAIATVKVHRESYEKQELLKLFTSEQLSPALKIQEYEQLRITDLERKEDNG